MARIFKILRTLRNNWKKSTVAALLLAYGSNYAKEKYTISQLMRAYCEEAKKYGDEPISVLSKPKHVTVILNPAARDGKGKKLYEKYAAPLLNLSGLKVSIIQTENEGQAKDLMGIMANTDAVIIAGGNGTLHEAVTGLLRRTDEAALLRKIPIGIAPIGKTNTVAKALFWKPTMLDEQLVAEATMAVIRESVQPIDVMKLQGDKGQAVYSLIGLDFGVFRDRDALISKYWYFGPLKRKVAYIFQNKKTVPISGKMSYVLPCPGCSRCFEKVQPQTTVENKRWWASFLPKSPVVKSSVTVKDFSNVLNDSCGIWLTKELEFLNLAMDVATRLQNGSEETRTSAMKVSIHPSHMTRSQIIAEGWRRGNDKKLGDMVECINIREGKLTVVLPEGEERWYSIDNENYEVQDIAVSLMPSKLNVFVHKK